LDSLLDLIPIEFHLPVYAEEDACEEAAVDEDAEVEAEEMADEVGAADVEEDEMYYHGGDDAGQVGEGRYKLTDSILDASVAPDAWRLELERVTPQLKMQVLSDPKEWRNRLVNTKSHHAKVAELTPETHATVERLADDLERTLAAVRKAEKKLSQQLQGEILEYTAKQEEMRAKQEGLAASSEQINTLTNELAAVSDELETVKARMEERGNSMSDTSPLIKIKSAQRPLQLSPHGS
jgi:estrogen-related receptor beta like 1